MTFRVIVNHAPMGFAREMDDPAGHSDFASRLKAVRKDAGLTQQTVADRIGISLRNYAAYEGGEKSPELSRLPSVAKALGVSVGELFDTVGPVSPEQALLSIKRDLAVLESVYRENIELRTRLSQFEGGLDPAALKDGTVDVGPIRSPDSLGLTPSQGVAKRRRGQPRGNAFQTYSRPGAHTQEESGTS